MHTACKRHASIQFATAAQKRFIDKLQTLSTGMSQEDVTERLGQPGGESPDALHYFLLESRIDGGYYIGVDCHFIEAGLARVEISDGHMHVTPAGGP